MIAPLAPRPFDENDLARWVHRAAPIGNEAVHSLLREPTPHLSPTAAGRSIEIARIDLAGASTPRGREDGWEMLLVVEGEVDARGAGGRAHLGKYDLLMLGVGERATLSSPGAHVISIALSEPNPRSVRLTPSFPRIARFSSIAPVSASPVMRTVAKRFTDVLSPRELYLLVGPKKLTPLARYALNGPAETLVTIAKTPTGTGPALHVHRTSLEIFVVLDGKFAVTLGDRGEHRVDLERFDGIAIPPGINRTFENAGGPEGCLLPIVVGADDELEDIVWLPAIARELAARVPAPLLWLARRTVLEFVERTR